VNLDVMGRLERFGQRHRGVGRVLAVHQRFSELHGSQMATAITLTAFLTLFPLALVAIAVLGFVQASSGDVADRLVDNLGLTGDAARTVTDAIGTAEQSRRLASVIGVLGLLWTGLGLSGAMAYAYNTAWQVQGRGMKDKLFALIWLGGLGVLVAAGFAATSSVEWLGGPASWLLVLGGIPVNVGIFLWTSLVLPNRRVGIRPLLPAAIVGGVALEVLKILGTQFVPRLVANSSALYGTLGVVFALLAWLLFLGRIVVYVAVIEVTGWERAHGTEETVIEMPALPEHTAAGATRAGERTP
jgi:membrane protein